MSLFSVLNTAASGLNASQMAMDVSGQNITNANTPGYSREGINQTAEYRSDGTYGQIGMGVDVVNIQRMRDSFVDTEEQEQNQQIGYYNQINNSLQGISNAIDEPSDNGLGSVINQFFSDWQNLADNPTDLSARTVVQTDGQQLTDTFHQISSNIATVQQSCNTQISADVDTVNQLVQQIYNLNQNVGIIQVNNQNANDSLDQEQVALQSLSKLIDISVITNANGQISVSSDGNVLVSPAYYQTLQTGTTADKLPDGSTETNIGVIFSNSKKAFQPQSGEMQALFQSRDVVIPQYQNMLNTLANGIVKSVNQVHSQGYNLKGYTGIDFFDPNSTGASDISLSPAITSDPQNIAAASGGGTVVEQPAFAIAAGQANFGNAPVQLLDANGNPVSGIVENSVVVKTPTATLTEGVDYHIDYTNGTIQMLNNGNDNQPLTVDFQYATGGFKGPGDNTNAVAIAALGSSLTMNPDILGRPTSSFTDYYSALVGKLGTDTNEATTNLDTRNQLMTQLQTQQDSVAGVSLDEEMTNLIKYQQSYQAAARIVTTDSTMFDSLLNMGTS